MKIVCIDNDWSPGVPAFAGVPLKFETEFKPHAIFPPVLWANAEDDVDEDLDDEDALDDEDDLDDEDLEDEDLEDEDDLTDEDEDDDLDEEDELDEEAE